MRNYYTVKEYAKKIGMSESGLRNRINNGKLDVKYRTKDGEKLTIIIEEDENPTKECCISCKKTEVITVPYQQLEDDVFRIVNIIVKQFNDKIYNLQITINRLERENSDLERRYNNEKISHIKAEGDIHKLRANLEASRNGAKMETSSWRSTLAIKDEQINNLLDWKVRQEFKQKESEELIKSLIKENAELQKELDICKQSFDYPFTQRSWLKKL